MDVCMCVYVHVLGLPVVDFKNKQLHFHLRFSFCYLSGGKADDVLFFLIAYNLCDAEHVPHQLPSWLFADIGVPQPEDLIISWKE